MYQQQLSHAEMLIYSLKTYKDPNRVRSDTAELLRNNPSLNPRSGTLTRNGPQIICLVGTIPVSYKMNTYNIPVNIWIPDTYPLAPPVVFVTPTSDMMISPRHRHVDDKGIVYLPYLSSWSPNSCSLVGLAGVLAQVFSEDPPVRAKTQSNRNSQQYPQQYGSPNSSGSWQQQSVPQQQQYSQNNYNVQARSQAIQNVTNKIQNTLQQKNQQTMQQMDSNMRKQNELENNLRYVEQEIKNLQQRKDQIGDESERYLLKTSEVQKWLEQNQRANDVDIDALTQPKEPLSNQLLQLVAQDATIEDALYYLEKGLGKERISLDEFMKLYRDLSTQQFICRATIKKVHEKQRTG